VSPKHSIGFCPVCGGGLCGIRICGIDPAGSSQRISKSGSDAPHGLVICDECEAIWLEPDTSTAHQYPSVDDSRCPICDQPLWGDHSRWADVEDAASLGWEFAINPDLDVTDEGLV
jgi:hypothetical protein